ncbi:S8/S53 family peptidase [Nocardioides sp.]|uniref:S8 family peptidase n=1 Tax=Nocardioides sp. TaxID=35761 RepID=UPI0027374FE2|nr:S8/S53 family peptidase [Nocardioides sp.]MDP3891459.1 S8/S53 family peptidase [Nocardioides sp.]
MTLALRATLACCLTAGTLVAGGPPAHAVDQDCSGIRADNPDPTTAERTGSPVQLMQIAQAQRIVPESTTPEERVVVAVLDSGVAGTDLIDVGGRSPRFSKSEEAEPLEMQGTAVAGLIAAKGDEDRPVGIAPDAVIYDVRIYDRLTPDDPATESGPDAAALLEGLRHVATQKKGVIDVVNVSVAVRHSAELDDELDAVLTDLAKKDVVVVAATGDRPEEADQLYAEFGYNGEEPPHGEDARRVVWPASDPRVLAVNASATVLVDDDVVPGDAADTVLRSSATDVAAPTADAVSVGMDGKSTCVLPEVSTAWAAAEVSGVVALLRAYYPNESAEQIVDRVKRTATGSPRSATTLTGHGVVQPVEALERPLPGLGDGPGTRIVDEGNERAEAPKPKADVLASTKRNAVWWGLLAGGALVVAVLLRPVLTRRLG